MRVTLAIAWKEIVAYYTSPMAYIVALMFLALTGFFFVNSIDRPFAEATISGMLDPVVFFMMWWLPPLLTMRLLAEEQKMGTIELLLTAPVYDWEVVIGKYLASLVFFITTLSLTLYYVLLLYWFGNPDSGPIWSAYLGTILYGAAALSVGLLASSLTSNQIVAAVIGVGLLLLLTFIDLAAGQVGGGLSTFLNEIGLRSHFDDFSRGVVDTSNLVYYLALTGVFLFLTIRSLESRRWR
jgi:ABC-2 type transport system permease protein